MTKQLLRGIMVRVFSHSRDWVLVSRWNQTSCLVLEVAPSDIFVRRLSSVFGRDLAFTILTIWQAYTDVFEWITFLLTEFALIQEVFLEHTSARNKHSWAGHYWRQGRIIARSRVFAPTPGEWNCRAVTFWRKQCHPWSRWSTNKELLTQESQEALKCLTLFSA